MPTPPRQRISNSLLGSLGLDGAWSSHLTLSFESFFFYLSNVGFDFYERKKFSILATIGNRNTTTFLSKKSLETLRRSFPTSYYKLTLKDFKRNSPQLSLFLLGKFENCVEGVNN